VADVAVLRGRDFLVIEVPRDDEYIRDLEAEEARFQRFVEQGVRPPIDGSEGTRRVLSAMHPRNDGALRESTPDVDDVVRQLAEKKAALKAAEAEADTLSNALRALIGDADGYVGPWGKVTWKKNADNVRVNWPAVAKAYRALITDRSVDELDAIESIHSETVTGPRVLRLDLKETA
jgi:hypothetical protein